jgi:transcription elongation factor GreB
MKNYITSQGAQKLKDELKNLLTKDRPELVKVVEWAASNGDRSENADYTYGKRRLREMDRRIRFLSKRLESAEIILPKDYSNDPGRVRFGATVVVKDKNETKRSFMIVGQDEIDPGSGKISWISPIGKALLNSKKGDWVQVETPRGIEELLVLEVEYISFD